MTDLRQVFDDLVRFETILWGAIDGRLQEECGVGLASLNAMLVIDATPLCRVHDIARAIAITDRKSTRLNSSHSDSSRMPSSA